MLTQTHCRKWYDPDSGGNTATCNCDVLANCWKSIGYLAEEFDANKTYVPFFIVTAEFLYCILK